MALREHLIEWIFPGVLQLPVLIVKLVSYATNCIEVRNYLFSGYQPAKINSWVRDTKK